MIRSYLRLEGKIIIVAHNLKNISFSIYYNHFDFIKAAIESGPKAALIEGQLDETWAPGFGERIAIEHAASESPERPDIHRQILPEIRSLTKAKSNVRFRLTPLWRLRGRISATLLTGLAW